MSVSMALPVVTKVKLDVPSLGTITGLCFYDQTCQYYGIPYATVPGRFRRPQPSPKPWPNNRWDGTKLG
jgi:carboxylesterase type B